MEINHPPQSSAKETDGFVAIAQEASDQGGACTWEERANEKSNENGGKTMENHSEIIELLGYDYHTIHIHSCWIYHRV